MVSDRLFNSRLQQQDREAFREFYDLYIPRIYHYILHVVKSPQLAEDIAHDIFVKIWDHAPAIDPGRPIEPFLFVITRHHLLNFLKRSARRKEILTEMARHMTSSANDTENAIAFAETSKRLENAISLLPPGRRQIYKLCHEDALTYKEVAERLNLSYSTVNNQMVRAIKAIKDYLACLSAIIAASLLLTGL